jgi:hypothetical protein
MRFASTPKEEQYPTPAHRQSSAAPSARPWDARLLNIWMLGSFEEAQKIFI